MKPVRVILTVAGMSVGIGAVLFLVSLGYGLQYILIGKLVSTEDSLITMEISYPTEANLVIKKSELDELRKIPEVEEVSPVAEFPGAINQKGNSPLLVDARIVELNYFRLAGFAPDIGRELLEGERGVIVSSQALGAVGIKADKNTIGKELFLSVFYQDDQTGTADEATSTEAFPIRGIISDATLAPTIIAFQQYLSKEPPFSRNVLVKAKNVDTVEKLRDVLLTRGFRA